MKAITPSLSSRPGICFNLHTKWKCGSPRCWYSTTRISYAVFLPPKYLPFRKLCTKACFLAWNTSVTISGRSYALCPGKSLSWISGHNGFAVPVMNTSGDPFSVTIVSALWANSFRCRGEPLKEELRNVFFAESFWRSRTRVYKYTTPHTNAPHTKTMLW